MTTQRTIVVFVPKPGTWIESEVDPESAIVGFEDDWYAGHPHIEVCSEGRHGGTFGDRVQHAANRLREGCLTTATWATGIPTCDLTLVGYWKDDHVVPAKTSDLADIGLWLALPSSDLANELKRTVQR